MKYCVLYWNVHATNKEPVTVYGPETYDKCLGYYEVMAQHRPAQYSMQRVKDTHPSPEIDYVKVNLPDITPRTASRSNATVAQQNDTHERIKRLQTAVKSISNVHDLTGDILLA